MVGTSPGYRASLRSVLGCIRSSHAGALLQLLYNTGARVSEVVALSRADIRLGPPCFVQLHGKGRKQRAVPVWKSTAKALKLWLKNVPNEPDTPLFSNRFGERLSRSGVEKRLRLTVQAAIPQCPSLRPRKISPHTFKHTTAMHLLENGVDITVIALWLGHESPATTHHYIELDLSMKRRALQKLAAPKTKSCRFEPSEQLLTFLRAFEIMRTSNERAMGVTNTPFSMSG